MFKLKVESPSAIVPAGRSTPRAPVLVEYGFRRSG